MCVCDIAEAFPVGQPTVSHHLRLLREAGLADVTRRGQWALYALRPGGRLVISDIVSAAPLPDELKTPELWSACVGGALPEADYLRLVAEAGFASVEVLSKQGWEAAGLFSVTVRAVEPNR